MLEPLDKPAFRRITRKLATAGIIWGLVVALAAGSGFLGSLPTLTMGPLIALGILIPSTVYFASPALKAYFRTIGIHRLTVFHVWRIAAAPVFFWYGARGILPPAFWMLAGGGDLLAGALALPLLRGRDGHHDYLSKNLFGFADFVVAIGTGLTLTLLHDPRMGAIRELPLALIPLFGVGITCTAHIIAFHLLWTERRASATPGRGERERSMRLPA